MLKVQNPQLDMFTAEVYNHLVPQNHLLVRIADAVDFGFVLEKLEKRYSNIGRGSYDPIMMFKIQLLCYLYQLSDGKVIQRAQTDIAFRWFLGLNIYDTLPDDTTISYFRVHRLDNDTLEDLFNDIVTLCIKKHLVKSKRLLIDSTNIEANTNYPSTRRLISESFHKLMKKLARFNEDLSLDFTELYASKIDPLYEKQEVVRTKEHATIVKEIMDLLYLKSIDLLEEQVIYREAFELCYKLVQQGLGEIKSDLIISTVDPDARVAHKSPGVLKRGYKDHIIVDEDSEIILASTTTAFNVGDEKELKSLVQKATKLLEKNDLIVQEISADTVYGTIENREYLNNKEIKTNIPFCKKSIREVTKFSLDRFILNEDLTEMTCPAGHVTHDRIEVNSHNTNDTDWQFKFNIKTCTQCPLKYDCLRIKENGKPKSSKIFSIPTCYKLIEADRRHNQTAHFKEAYNKRYRIERRFATMVKNHMLRRSRFLRVEGATKHNMLANMACNLVRLTNILEGFNRDAKLIEVTI